MAANHAAAGEMRGTVKKTGRVAAAGFRVPDWFQAL
jgi:hypothetical protein